jgi:hypothetical protein
MAAPNIVGVATVTGKTTYLSIPDTIANVLLSNAASSNSVYKVNSIIVANDSGAGTAKIIVKVHDAAAGGGTAYNIANNVGIASETTLVILDKASSIYLEENNSITVQANQSNYLDVVCSYEEIS